MFKKLMITCDQATTICDKSQYHEATILEKLQLNIHLLICRFCVLYVKQNLIMTKIFKMKAKNCKHHLLRISDEDKAILKKQIQDLKS